MDSGIADVNSKEFTSACSKICDNATYSIRTAPADPGRKRKLSSEKKYLAKQKRIDKLNHPAAAVQQRFGLDRTIAEKSSISELRAKIEDSIFKSQESVAKFKKFSDLVESKFERGNDETFVVSPSKVRYGEDSFTSDYSFLRVDNEFSFNKSRSTNNLSFDCVDDETFDFKTLPVERKFFETPRLPVIEGQSNFNCGQPRSSKNLSTGNFSNPLSIKKCKSIDDLSDANVDTEVYDHYVNLITAKPFGARKSIGHVSLPFMSEQKDGSDFIKNHNVLETSFIEHTWDS